MANATMIQVCSVLGAGLVAAGCSQRPDVMLVGGAARLTVLAVGAVTAAINEDAVCGFANPDVLAKARVEGLPGGRGSVTLTTRACALDLGTARQDLSEDCNGHILWARGRVTVSARRTITGLLTGDPATPVIPDGPDAVTVRILEARADGFEAGSTQADASLTVEEGTLTAVVRPRLARAASTGLCAVPTPLVSMTDVTWEAARLKIRSGGMTLPLPVQAASLSAHIGRHGRVANRVEGSITVLRQTVSIPSDEDRGELDPGYSERAFLDGYACTPDLQVPVSHVCTDPLEMMALPMAQLSVAAFATVVGVVQADAHCGFSAPPVAHHPVMEGELGRPGGVATLTITTPCTVRLPSPVTLPPVDCAHPESPTVSGTVHVTGTMTLRGILTGDPLQPIIPTSRDPAELALTVRFEDYSVTPPGAPVRFVVHSGTMQGALQPRLALDTSLGVCAIPTPVMEIPRLTGQDLQVQLFTPGPVISGDVRSLDLRAINGAKDGEENVLSGQLVLGGEPHVLPDGTTLNPDYDPVDFASYEACTPNLGPTPSDDACSFGKVMAPQAARLIILGLGGVARVLQSTPACGLPQMDSLPPPPDNVDPSWTSLAMRWDAQECALHAVDAPVLEECTGRTITATGNAVASGSVTMTLVLPPLPPFGPMARDGVAVSLGQVRPQGWSVRVRTPGMEDAVATLDGGMLSAMLHPVMGEHDRYPALYIIPTPIAGWSDVVVEGVTLTIKTGPKTLRFRVDEAHLVAFSGAYAGQRNLVAGSVTLDGQRFDLGTLPLDPDYTQERFDASYVGCTPSLRGAVSPL